MRRFIFDPDKCDGWPAEQAKSWNSWSDKASKAKTVFRNYSLGNPPEPNSEIWAELKRWLLVHVFSGKCAYCEIKISGGFYGEGEHYRPKKRVSVRKDGKLAVVDTPPNDGYFWLMYDWQNLVPSCQECNNEKRDQFPAKRHALQPAPTSAELDQIEQPLLLHPYRDDPSDHIRFGKFGIVAAIDGSEKGRETIEALGLDRDTLTERRREKQEQAHSALKLAWVQYVTNQVPLTQNADLQNYMRKSAEFSACVQDFVEQAHAEYILEFSKSKAVTEDEE
jgi:uncharacterized protein (TIGR02646 family)